MNRSFLRKRWGDGLPLIPPTEERIRWLLRGVKLPRNTVMGRIPPRQGIATVEVIAANAAMAGARPEYMPVIVAALKAMIGPEFDLGELQATMNPVVPAVVVNGPIAKQIGLNSRYNLLGPNPEFPAGATIGRAIRLALMNIGGAIPGVTDMAGHGQPGKYTGLVFAEAEDESPWEPLSVDRGYPAGTNLVTVLGVAGTLNIHSTACNEYPGTQSQQAEAVIRNIAKHISIPSRDYWNVVGSREERWAEVGICIMSPGRTARQLADRGWSKQYVKEALFSAARVSVKDFSELGPCWGHPDHWLRAWPWLKPFVEGKPPDALVPVASSPKGFLVVVAGGDTLHTIWMTTGYSGGPAQSVEIDLPPAWEDLVREARGYLKG
ncbi:MAG: hypothetical protein HY675_17160 [Chloroflexi bacterium]|nr:hypothetical protein [Chloroflexota bacterium]